MPTHGNVRGNVGMRWRLWSAVALAVVVLIAGADPALAAADPDRVAAAQLLSYVNADRAAAGLAPLAVSNVAVEVAEAWSQYMSDIGDLAHNDGWFTAETKQRAGAGAVGENVATNVDLADAHRRLMNSPGHRANILDPRFHQVGIGVVKGPSGAWWITEDFLQVKNAPAGAAPPAPPAADPTNPPPAPPPTPAPAPPPPPAASQPAPAVPAAPAPAPPAAEPARADSTDAPAAPTPVAATLPQAEVVPDTPPPLPAGQELAAGALRPDISVDRGTLFSPGGLAAVALALAGLFACGAALIRARRSTIEA